MKSVRTSQLDISYLEFGADSGWPCILCHGFPYDVHAYAECGQLLADAGARVFVPWLRGYGDTRFLSDSTMRSGEQAVLANDLLEFMDALHIERAVLGGYDWGGRAACIVSALWPERVVALVSGNAYNIQDIARCNEPESAQAEASYWYQYFFHTERGRNALLRSRREFTHLLWKMWSPTWRFDDETFERSAASFDNPDFVEVVLHSYRHRYALVAGDPGVSHIETALVAQPDINVPAIAIDGEVDGVIDGTAHHAKKFTAAFEHRLFKDAGHNLPQEKPRDWVRAVLDARAMSAAVQDHGHAS